LVSNKSERIHVSVRDALGLLIPYVKSRVLSQVKSIWLIILYLIFFQKVVLGISISGALVIACGIVLVVIGLTLFMEGLMLGLMPLGELVGVRLPQRSGLPMVLGFALVLGFLATLAEPSINVLQMAGESVKPWEAPLLFLLLNLYAPWLVYTVGAGVGVAVCLGMIRFYYSFSLKPFIYILVGALCAFTVWASFDPNLSHIVGLAWDCGAVTTGPVTVPLVLALGIGISRMFASSESGATGFGVVTLASLLPVLAVFILSVFLLGMAPRPIPEKDFFKPENRVQAERLLGGENRLLRYVFVQAKPEGRLAFFDNDYDKMAQFLDDLYEDDARRKAVFGEDPEALKRWVALHGTEGQQRVIFGNQENLEKYLLSIRGSAEELQAEELLKYNTIAAIKAIGLLTIPLFVVLFFILRDRLPQPDEIFLGLFLCIAGLGLFGIGIEIGLNRLGTQIGSKLPSSFKAIQLPEEREAIADFDPAMVHTAISSDGRKHLFFYAKKENRYVETPYYPKDYDPKTGRYHHIPTKGPLFGDHYSFAGIGLVLFFAFVMGYGATLAEPALNALGLTVEALTAGAFKKSFLMQAVAVGVGGGITLGVAKIIWNIPLAWLLVPPYLLLLLLTRWSTEEYVNIGWDSAGVTTGPITVPLVLTMGLGISTQVGVVEGFGILAAASVCPILSVLGLGLYAAKKREAALRESIAGEPTGESRT
jgi:hypothetical protein